jgi:tetratricopeptide (TPR) repeat protein
MTVAFRLRLGEITGSEAEGTHPAPVAEPSAGDQEFNEHEALRAFGLAARRGPNDPDYDYILGQALLRAGRPAEAAGHCREAVRLDRSNPDYNSALGATLARLGREQEAVPVIEEALRLGPRLADAHGNLGAALWNLGRAADALRALRRAVRLRPDEPEHLRNVALALAALGRRREAVDILRKVVALRPDRPEALLDLGEALYDAGRADEVTKVFDEALRLDPAAMARRPRSREVRDTLRLRQIREDANPGRPSRGPLAHALGGLFGLGGAVSGALRQRGRLVTPLLLATLGGLGWITWALVPHYVAHYLLQDDLTAVARPRCDWTRTCATGSPTRSAIEASSARWIPITSSA